MIRRTLKVPVLDAQVLVLIVTDKERLAARMAATRWLRLSALTNLDPERCQAYACANGTRAAMVFHHRPDLPLLAHEAVHVADDLLQSLELPKGKNPGPSELRALLVEHLTRKLQRILA
jgi:hypothetical protein